MARPWANLQADEEEAPLDCGCVLRRPRSEDGPINQGADVVFLICPMHEEAARTLALLKRYQGAGEQLTKLVKDTAEHLARVG